MRGLVRGLEAGFGVRESAIFIFFSGGRFFGLGGCVARAQSVSIGWSRASCGW